MKKKAYSIPQMDIVMLQQQQALLQGSYGGAANAPEVDFEDFNEMNMLNPTPTVGNPFIDKIIGF